MTTDFLDSRNSQNYKLLVHFGFNRHFLKSILTYSPWTDFLTVFFYIWLMGDSRIGFSTLKGFQRKIHQHTLKGLPVNFSKNLNFDLLSFWKTWPVDLKIILGDFYGHIRVPELWNHPMPNFKVRREICIFWKFPKNRPIYPGVDVVTIFWCQICAQRA